MRGDRISFPAAIAGLLLALTGCGGSGESPEGEAAKPGTMSDAASQADEERGQGDDDREASQGSPNLGPDFDDAESTEENVVLLGPTFARADEIHLGERPIDNPVTEAVVIRNILSEAVAVAGVRVAGEDATDFTLAGTTCTAGAELGPGEQCVVEVVFTPTEAGKREAVLLVEVTGARSAQVALIGEAEGEGGGGDEGEDDGDEGEGHDDDAEGDEGDEGGEGDEGEGEGDQGGGGDQGGEGGEGEGEGEGN